MEYKSIIASNLAEVESDGRFTGYASVFDKADEAGDIVLKGAFTRSLKRRSPKLLYEHDIREPIGFYDRVYEDDIGLKVSGQIIPETIRGAHTIALMKHGVLDGLSIGYDTVKKSYQGNNRIIEEADLWEVSTVIFPMHGDARIMRSLPDIQETGAKQVLAFLNEAESIFNAA